MGRYEQPDTGAYVEIAGASALTFAELDTLYQRTPLDAGVRDLLAAVVTAAEFPDRAGQPVDVCASGFEHITPAQWNWLRDQIMLALRDELLPPAI